MAFNLEQFNERVENWTSSTVQAMKAKAQGLGIQHREGSPSPGPSVNKIRGKLRIRVKDGVYRVISIGFPRSLVWPHKGAGKGMAGTKGSSWVDAQGKTKKTNSQSMGKMGTGSRTPKPWFNEVMDSEEGITHLADIAAEELGDSIVNNALIK